MQTERRSNAVERNENGNFFLFATVAYDIKFVAVKRSSKTLYCLHNVITVKLQS